MNRDEIEAQRENMTSTERLASDLSPKVAVKGRMFVGATLVPQEVANQKISLATRNARTWSAEILEAAFRAARPVAEAYLRSTNRVASRNDERQLTRSYLASYVKQFGVLLPPGTTLGGSALESAAAEMCGPLDTPLSFMPPTIQVPIRLAQQAPKQAKSWFARLFSHGPKAAAAETAAPVAAAPAAAAATPAVAAAAPVAAVATSAAGGAAPVATPAEQQMMAKIVTMAKQGNPNAKAALLRLQKEGYAVSLGNESFVGAWMYKLNPLYWVKSSEQKQLIDKEREGWEKNADLQKQLGKRQEVLDQATKAQQAQMAVQAAQARSAELETQLKSIETQLSGIVEVVGDGVMGKDKTSPKPNPYEGSSDDESPDVSDEAAPVLDRVKKARSLNENNTKDLATVAKKMAAGKPLSPTETANAMQYLARNERLHEFRKTLVSGENYAKNPARPEIQRQVILGAMKAMNPTEQQMMVQIVKLAKQGNPNAQAALKKLQAQGYAVTMGDNLGWGISDAFSLAVAPIKYGIVKPTQWLARKVGITHGGSASPQQIRMQRLQAAAKRQQAADARARAADAETEAEQRVQAQEAAAAQAEADAIDAQATAKEAQMATEEAQYAPAPAAQDDGSDDQSGKDVTGKVEVTPLPPTPTAADQLKAARRAIVAKKNPKAARILAASEANTPQGKKLKASMQVYANAKKGSRKDRAAIINMVKKAKKGDAQARQDVLAMKAAQIAVKADKKAGRAVAIATAKNAANKKGIAIQRRLEASAAQTLTRRTRAHKLAKVAKIERQAAAGHKPSQAVIKNVVAKAKTGDKNALAAARAFKLAQTARVQNPTRAERKKQIAAHKLVLKLKKGNKKSLAELRVLKSAAANGNPNAKKALDKVKTAAALETALATGAIVLPAGVALSIEQKKKHAKKQKAMQKHIASVESKIAKGTASREEALKAASEAKTLGQTEKVTALTAEAAELPSAQDNLKRVATVAAAAAAGSAPSQEKIARAQTLAEAGDPSGVAAMGQLAAVKALDDARQGKPVEPAMKTAVQDLEKAGEGDEAAKARIAAMQEQSKTGDSNAVKYMVYATGATVVARALANNPAAEEEWKQKAGVKPADSNNNYVETSKVALALPPMASSLPDAPLEPIVGIGELIKESLRALLFATKDPVQNYREAVLSKARLLPAIDGLGAEGATAKGGKKQKTDSSKKVRDELEAIDEELSPGLQAQIEARRPKIALEGEDEPAPKTGKAAHEDYSQPSFAKKAGSFVAQHAAKKTPDQEYEVHGDDDKQAQIVAATKARLGKVIEAAGKGDKDAMKKVEIAKANYKKHKAAADKGDAKAKNIVAILDATGLFTKL